MSQAASSKGRENVSKQKTYASLNLNQTFVGSKAETKIPSGVPRHGMQTLGKIGQTRRPPPPANLPSLKKENLGNDPSVALVPSGKSGWGKKEKDAKASQEQTPPQQQSQQQQPSPSIQAPVKTIQPEEVSLKPNAGVVPKTGESKKSWTSAKPLPPSSAATGTTPPPSTYFQREFPSLGGSGGPGKPQREGEAEGANGRGPDAVGRPAYPSEQFGMRPDEREARQVFNGNPPFPQQQQQRQQQPFYPQQPYGEHFGPHGMYPINRGGVPGFPPMHPGAYPFPVPGVRKDQMHQFEQHCMRMPMHGGAQPQFPPSDGPGPNSEQPPQAKKANAPSSHEPGSRIDWADTPEELDYNARLKFDESDGETSPSPRPDSSKKKSSKGDSRNGNKNESQRDTPSPHVAEKDAATANTNQEQTTEPGPPQEAWAEMYPGFQGPMPMPYPGKWGFMPPYDPRQPMQMPHPYHQYPPNWYFMQQAQMRMGHPMASGEASEGELQARTAQARSDTGQDAKQETSNGNEKIDQTNTADKGPAMSHDKDGKGQSPGARQDASHHGSGPRGERADNDRDGSKPSGLQQRHSDQSFSKSSNEVPPRFRTRNQQRQSPSLDHPAKTAQGDDVKSYDKATAGHADGQVRKIIKRRDSARSDDAASIHSLDEADKQTATAKDTSGNDGTHRGGKPPHDKSNASRSDQRDRSHGRGPSDANAKKNMGKTEKATSQGKASTNRPFPQDKVDKTKSAKSKSIKEGMKKLEKGKFKANASAKPNTAVKQSPEIENEKSSGNADKKEAAGDQKKTAWASVVTGGQADVTDSATQAESAKKSLVDIQREQEQKDREASLALKATDSHTTHQDRHHGGYQDRVHDRQEEQYDRQANRGRERYDPQVSRNFPERRHPDDRKRKHHESDARGNDGGPKNYGNRRDNDGYDHKPSSRVGNHNQGNRYDGPGFPQRNRGSNYDEDQRYENRKPYKTSRPGQREYTDQRKNYESRHKPNASASSEVAPSLADAPATPAQEGPVTSSSATSTTAQDTITVSQDTPKAVVSLPETGDSNKDGANMKDGATVNTAVAVKDGTAEKKQVVDGKETGSEAQSNKREGHSTRRKESEKYSSKYPGRFDERRRSKPNERQGQSNERHSQRSYDRRRDADEKHPDRPLYSGRGRGQAKGPYRDTAKPANRPVHHANKQEESKTEETAVESKPSTGEVKEAAPIGEIAAFGSYKPGEDGKAGKTKVSNWGDSDSGESSYESCSDSEAAPGKAASKATQQQRGKSSTSVRKPKQYDKHYDEATAPRFQKAENAARGRGRYPRRGVGRIGSKPGFPRSFGRGQASRDGRGTSNTYHGASSSHVSSKNANEDSSDAEYHSADETAMLPEAGHDENHKTNGRHADADRAGHSSSRGSKRGARGRGSKSGHFLGHRQQAGGRSSDSLVLNDASPAAENQDVGVESILNGDTSAKGKKEHSRAGADGVVTDCASANTDQGKGGSDDKKGARAAKQPTVKVNIFNTFDVRDIAGVVCIDDRPQDEVMSPSKGDDDDGFVEVTYKRGVQKEQREKQKKDVKKKSRDEPSKSQKGSVKSDSKPNTPKHVRPTKSSPEPLTRLSPVLPPNISSSSATVATVQSVTNSNAAMAAVGEWEPARSLMRSTSNNANSSGSVEQPQASANPVTPPPGNAWQRPLTFAAASHSQALQHTPDPKAVGSGKPKPQQQTSTLPPQSVVPMLQSLEQSLPTELNEKPTLPAELKAEAPAAGPAKPKVPKSSGKERNDRQNHDDGKERIEKRKRDGKSVTSKQPTPKRSLKKVAERRATRETAPRFQAQNRGKVNKKDTPVTAVESGHQPTDPCTEMELQKVETSPSRAVPFPKSVNTESESKLVDSSYIGVPLEMADVPVDSMASAMPSPTKMAKRHFSEEDAQNAKDTARSVIKSLGDDDERNLETKSLPGSPPLVVDIPEPTLSGPSSDPGHSGSPGPRSMVHEFTEMSMKLLSTKVKEVWDNPINDSGRHKRGSQMPTHSWSEASCTSDVSGQSSSAPVTQSSADKDILHQVESSDPLNSSSKRDEGIPLQRSQDVFNAKRLSNDAQNVCKVKPRQQQSEIDNNSQVSYSSPQLLSSQHHDSHQSMPPPFQSTPGQKASSVSQFVVASDRRATQVVQPTVLHGEHDFSEGIHQQHPVHLQQAATSSSRLHSSPSPLSQTQDMLQQRMVLSSVYGQPGMSMPQNQMLAPWQVMPSQVQAGTAGSFRSQVHHNGTLFSASPVSLPSSAMYMAFEPQPSNNACILPSQVASSHLQHQQVGFMLPRQGPHHQANAHSSQYINMQGQQYSVRPSLGSMPDMAHSDNSALINHVHAKPFKPQTAPQLGNAAPQSQQQHLIHNQLVASVRPRPMAARNVSAGASPPMLHDHARLGSPPIDPSMQFVAARMQMKGHMLPPNAQMSQHIGGALPAQLFRQQQSNAATYVQRGPSAPMQPQYHRPIPGPIQRPGSSAVPLTSQVVGPAGPRPGLPYQTVQSIQAGSLGAHQPVYSKVIHQQEVTPPGGFRDLQHQKMIADTQKFFMHTEPVPRRATLPERASQSIDHPADNGGGDVQPKQLSPILLPVGSGPNTVIDKQQPHSPLETVDTALLAVKEQQQPSNTKTIVDLEPSAGSSLPAKDSPTLPINISATDA